MANHSLYLFINLTLATLVIYALYSYVSTATSSIKSTENEILYLKSYKEETANLWEASKLRMQEVSEKLAMREKMVEDAAKRLQHIHLELSEREQELARKQSATPTIEAIQKTATDLTNRIVFLLTTSSSREEMHYLREVVGSIHQFRKENQQNPLAVIYGFELSKADVDEILMWSNIVYLDAKAHLLQQELLPFGGINIRSLQYNTSVWLTIMKSTLENYGNVLYLDKVWIFKNNNASSKSPTGEDHPPWKAIERTLSSNGYIFGMGDNPKLIETTYEFSYFNFSAIGFTYKSAAYSTHIENNLACLRGHHCNASLDRQLNEWKTNLLSSATFTSTDIKSFGMQQADGEGLHHGLYFCYIDIRDDLLYNFAAIESSSNNQFLAQSQVSVNSTYSEAPSIGSDEFLNSKSQIIIALGIPVTSFRLTDPLQAPFLHQFLPGFLKSISVDESKRFSYRLYIGYDHTDHFWDSSTHFEKLNIAIQKQINGSDTLKNSITVHYVRFPQSKGWLTFIWNSLYLRALRHGSHYYFQVNDDLKLDQSLGWSTTFVKALQERQDFAVAGPYDPVWNCTLLTQAFVGRKHYKTFGWFFPPEIKDWYSDFWISDIYGPSRTFCHRNITAVNLRQHDTRYRLCNQPKWWEAKERDKKVIERAISADNL